MVDVQQLPVSVVRRLGGAPRRGAAPLAPPRRTSDEVGGADGWVGLTASADRRPPAAGDAGRQAGP